MKYLYRPRKRRWTIHLWDEEKEDTYCRMWSTGGINKDDKGWVKQEQNPKEETIFKGSKKICTMCKNKSGKS